MRSGIRLAAVAVLLVCLATGCESSNVSHLSGVFTVNGQPWNPPKQYLVMCSLVPEADPTSASYAAEVEEDGRFTVRADADGNGIPPGRYRVTLMTTLAASMDPDDLFQGTYLSNNSPLVIEAVRGEQQVTVDLQIPQRTANRTGAKPRR